MAYPKLSLLRIDLLNDFEIFVFLRRKTPNYKIVREPAEGEVEFLVAEIELPNIVSYSRSNNL